MSDNMDDLIRQYAEMHEAGHFTGRALSELEDTLSEIIHHTQSRTVLDYGSGKGAAYTLDGVHRKWAAEVTCFDPAVQAFKTRPSGPFDGVICNDVMEHIPESHVPEVLRDVLSYATKFAFFQICTRKAKKFLPDGRNCHLTVKDSSWWMARIGEAQAAVGGPPVIRVMWHLEGRERVMEGAQI